MSIRVASRHGVDFWNRMLALLYYKLNTSSPQNYTVKRDYRDGYRVKVKWPELQWENASSVYRLKINNEGVINGDYTTELENAFLIHLDVAKFNLMIPKKYGSGYQLTSLVTVEHFRDPMDHVKFVGDVQHLWAVAGGPGSGFHPEGPPSDSYYLKLSCAVNWYL